MKTNKDNLFCHSNLFMSGKDYYEWAQEISFPILSIRKEGSNMMKLEIHTPLKLYP